MSELALPPMALRLMGDSAALSLSPLGIPGDEQALAMLAMPSISNNGALSLPSGVTYSRSSTAMIRDWENIYRVAEIDEARFQGARRVYNSAPNADLNSGSWTKVASSVPATTYPGSLGALTLYKLTEDSASTFHYTHFTYVPNVGDTILWSCELKAAERFRVRLTMSFAGGGGGDFNLTTGVATGNHNSGVALCLLPLGNGYYRCYAKCSTTSASAGQVQIQLLNASGSNNYQGDGASGLYVGKPFLQVITGQSNANPASYVAPQTAVRYATTNGNTVTSQVLTEAAGVPLHPTRVVDGQRVFDTYPIWAATTAYAIGQRIIPATGTGPAGGDGYWYYCSTAGTSDSGEPTFGSGTTADGTAVWTRGGYYRIGGYLHAQAATNLNNQSRDFSNVGWLKVGGSVGSGSVTAPDATTRTTNTFTASAPNATLLKTITAASASYITQIFLKRSVGTGGVDITIDGGSTWVPVTLTSEWKPFSVSQTVLNPTIGIRVQTTADAVLIDFADLLAGSIPMAPIPTAGSTVAKSADTLTLPASAFVDARGTLVADVQHIDWSQAAGQVLGDGTEAVLKLATTVSGAQSDDGTTTISGPAGTPTGVMRQAVRWSGSARQVFVNGVAGTAGAYDGSFNLASLAIGPSALNALIKNLRLYPLDVSATRLLYLSAKDTA